MCLISCCGVNSTHTVHQGLLCCFTLYITFFWGYAGQTFTQFLWGLLVWFVSGGTAAHGPNVFWSTPVIQKSTIKNYMGGIPIDAKDCLCLTDFKQSAFTLYFSQKHCTAYHQVQTSMEIIPYMKAPGVVVFH